MCLETYATCGILTTDTVLTSQEHELMHNDRAYNEIMLQDLLSSTCAYCLCVSQDKFLPFVDMFQKDSVKVEICKTIMEAFCK